MSAKENLSEWYQTWRNRELGPLTESRADWGAREFDTIMKLQRLSGVGGPATLANTKSVLDLGCGDSHIKPEFEAHGWEYRGIDIDECDFDNQRLPVADGRHDLVVSLAVLEHLTAPLHFLLEIQRVLKPGGVIVLSTPNWQCCFKSFWNDPTHVRPYTQTALSRIADIAGYDDVSIFPGLRCKPDWCYSGKTAFWRARWFFPFTGEQSLAPKFLRGRSTSLFLIARTTEVPEQYSISAADEDD